MPKTVIKSVRDVIDISGKNDDKGAPSKSKKPKKMSSAEREKMIEKLTSEMKSAARMLEFEKAAYLRDEIKKLREG